MTDFHNQSRTSARRSDYVWQYEYYDDEEPVSFEGLKAHRYSIVIGFWVGLAVFVIFMFFVLTLLTKTGAPHQENPDTEKRHRPGNCSTLDAGCSDEDNEKAFSRPLLTESRSYFHFYITEEQGKQKPAEEAQQNGHCKKNGERVAKGIEDIIEAVEDDGGNPDLDLVLDETKTNRDCGFVSHFNIPNFVSLDQSSNLGEEDILYEPSVTLERQARSQDAHCDIH